MSTPEADLLKVAPDAGLEEIKTAYRKAALAHHPDQNPHPDAARHFRRITEAYRMLEAKALAKQPPRPRRPIPVDDRIGFFLGDIGALVRRWPAERWDQSVDGLSAWVWVASALEVLAGLWPESPPSPAVAPGAEGIATALALWSDRIAAHPLPRPLPRALKRALNDAVQAAEDRLRALDRPLRRRSK